MKYIQDREFKHKDSSDIITGFSWTEELKDDTANPHVRDNSISLNK